MATVLADIDSATSELLDQAAAARKCSREEAATLVLAEALREEQALIEAARVGAEDFAAGRWITHDELVARLDRLAHEKGISKAALVEKLLIAYEEDAFLQPAYRDLEEGYVVSHDEFTQRLNDMQRRARDEIARRAQSA